jgi:transcriptional regulator with XRE-family HTH domain
MVQRIKAIKNALGISENELARRLGISQSTLNGYTLGKRTPSYEFAETVLNAFSDISAEWLLRGKGSMYISDIPADGDSEQVLDLKAELMRKEGEVEGLRQTIADLKAAMAKREAQLDKLINILHEERNLSPSLSIVAEEPTYTNTNNLK